LRSGGNELVEFLLEPTDSVVGYAKARRKDASIL
jgi:hypothetical protein